MTSYEADANTRMFIAYQYVVRVQVQYVVRVYHLGSGSGTISKAATITLRTGAEKKNTTSYFPLYDSLFLVVSFCILLFSTFSYNTQLH